jgi:hypothetical protein
MLRVMKKIETEKEIILCLRLWRRGSGRRQKVWREGRKIETWVGGFNEKLERFFCWDEN